MKIGLVTCEEEENLYGEDVILLNELIKRGHDSCPVVWNDKGVDFKAFNILILRSVWDYHYKIDEFQKWLGWIESQNICLINSVDSIKFNINKNYLSFFTESGFNVVPSYFLKNATPSLLKTFYKYFNCEEIIIKIGVFMQIVFVEIG